MKNLVPKAAPRSSRLRAFYKLSRGERLDRLQAFAQIPVDQLRILGQDGALPFEVADLFVENALGSYPLPLGLATSFKVNDEDYLLPMAVEESSVIAAASNAARWVYNSGGFTAETISSEMIGQIQVLDVDIEKIPDAVAKIEQHKGSLIEKANSVHPRLLMRGGGARDLEVRVFCEAPIPFLVVHIYMDCQDAMGANLVNSVCEALASDIETITAGRVGLRILSNLADRRLFVSRALINVEELSYQDAELQIPGHEIAKRMLEAFYFADSDPYRAATHNKGIMNGIDPLVIATGNDWRATEAGMHAYAARSGRYRSLSTLSLVNDGKQLAAEIKGPMQLGTVGGVTRLHPSAALSLKILGSPSSEKLSWLALSSGLASNLAAMRALVSSGIQQGHMKLHAKNLALAAGARKNEIEFIARKMVEKKSISASTAEVLLEQYRAQKPSELLSPEASAQP